MIRVVLPAHLRTLAHAGSEITVCVKGPVTIASILDAVATGAEPYLIIGAMAGG